MRSSNTLLAAIAAFALVCSPVAAQTLAGAKDAGAGCSEGDINYFTPRITEFGRGAGIATGCAAALALAPESSGDLGASPDNDLERRIDRLTLTPDLGAAAQPVFVVTGDSRSLILGARSGVGGFSVGGYYAHPRAAGTGSGLSGVGSYGLGAAYEADDWWIGLAYRRLGEARLALETASDPLEAIELSGQYQLGSGINLHGSLGFTDRSSAGPGGGEPDDGGWYIVGSVKIPF